MNKIIADKIDELKNLCKTYSVKTMYVFGSVCTDKFNEKSDVDILISFDNLSMSSTPIIILICTTNWRAYLTEK